MPPRGAPPRGRGGSAAPSRGAAVASGNKVAIADHVETIGVRRPDYGSAGRVLPIYVNSFTTTIPDFIIHHYDVVISPSEKVLPAKMNMDLIENLQSVVAPKIFTPRVVYDGRKNVFSPRALPLRDDTQEFDVVLGDPAAQTPGGKGPKGYKIRLTKVAEINPETLKRFISGQQSHDNTVLTAITALNVVIRMAPTQQWPFNVRSFFTDRETKNIGGGLELWRGYFQSLRPGIGKMLINVDISTGCMYKPGPLMNLCLEFVGRTYPKVLAPARGFPDRERIRLMRFISGIRIVTSSPDKTGRVQATPRVIKKLSSAGADKLTFTMREGGSMTVAQYFAKTLNKPLQFPEVVGSGALIPLELCIVPPGQIMRKQVPPEKTKDVLDFSTMRPADRLRSITNGLGVLAYGQSDYVRQFHMTVDTTGPLKVQARVLNPPVLKYGPGSKQLTIKPANGAWNMVDKKFYKPCIIERWVVVVYETQRRFGETAAQDMVAGFLKSSKDVGINIKDQKPLVIWENGQGNIASQLRAAGMACRQKTGGIPSLMVIILPEGGNDIYTAVKHFGDCTMGVATQCLKSVKCFRAREKYYANVALKVNVKMGGINTIPEAASVQVLTDPRNPTIVLGADVIHPAPGSDGRPSFTSLVGNVDSDTAKYIAASRVQTSRQEMIEELQPMAKHILSMYMRYREVAEKKGAGNAAPKRLLYYRDGVSEGQFAQVLSKELSALKAACEELNINPNITVIVVGKRHHVRFFPQNERDGDRSGNCPAGTVVDRDVSHPTENDFYLQSHGGLLGTSRPAHYSVLYDENNFSADGLQSLSFALCHVYARSTRSVSIPAPVYYADIVCTRAKNHYDPMATDGFDFSDSATQIDSNAAQTALEQFQRGFKPTHANMSTVMYFS